MATSTVTRPMSDLDIVPSWCPGVSDAPDVGREPWPRGFGCLTLCEGSRPVGMTMLHPLTPDPKGFSGARCQRRAGPADPNRRCGRVWVEHRPHHGQGMRRRRPDGSDRQRHDDELDARCSRWPWSTLCQARSTRCSSRSWRSSPAESDRWQGCSPSRCSGTSSPIGALNDIVDVEADRPGKARKPDPRRPRPDRVRHRCRRPRGGRGSGHLRELRRRGPDAGSRGLRQWRGLRRVDASPGAGWLCFAAALPLLLAWTWLAAAGSLPPGWPFLLPLAALAGPALHLANSLVDVDSDAQTGRGQPGHAPRAPQRQGGTGDPDGGHPRARVGHAGVGRFPLEPRSRRDRGRDRHDRTRRDAFMGGAI